MEKDYYAMMNEATFRAAVVERLDTVVALLEYMAGVSVEGVELEVEHGKESSEEEGAGTKVHRNP